MTRSALGTLAAAAAVLLTLSCLGPLFAPGGGWVGPAIAAVILAAVCGALGRALPLSGLSGTVLVAVGGLGLVSAVSTPEVAYLGFIPNGRSLSMLSDLFSSGFSDIRIYAPPVEASPGLVLLVTASVFAVAVTVDLFAVGAERPVLAGIPLLALVAVPAAFQPHGLGILHLLLAFIGWLLLVAVDSRDRLARWGRPLGRQSNKTAPLLIGGAAGRVAGVGVLAAFLLPALIPDLHGGIIHPPSTCCAGGSATVVPPLVTIDNQLHSPGDEQLLRVTTTAAEYLRFTALDSFDGNGFSLVKSDASPGKVDGPLSSSTPGITEAITQIPVNASIQVLPTLAESYLPLPYSPVDVKIAGTWQLSPTLRTVFSTTDTTAGKTFTVTSMVPSPTPAQLRAVPDYSASQTPAATAHELAVDLALPSSIPKVLYTDADRQVAGQKNAFDKLAALEHWFTTPSDGGFHYTLTPSPPLGRGAAGITSFLKNKQGFCEQFATVFTLMARHLGLPARVAVGFTPGTPDPSSPGVYDVSTADAHAWPEVWFTGVGWVRFEPTPRVGDGISTPSYLAAVKPATQPATTATPTAAPSTAPLKKPDADALKTKPLPTQAVTASAGTSLKPFVVLAAVLFVLLLALTPAIGRLLLRRRRVQAARAGAARDADPAEIAAGSHALWSELMDTVRDVGVLLPASETPRAIGRRVAGLLLPATHGGTTPDVFDGTPFALGARRPAPNTAPIGEPAPGGAPGPAGEPGPAGKPARGGVETLERPVETVELGHEPGARRPANGRDPGDLLAALGRTVGAEEQARYGRPGNRAGAAAAGTPGAAARPGVATPPGAFGAADDPTHDVAMIRGALIGTTSGAGRLQAVLLPRSVIGRARGRARLGGRQAGRLAAALGAPSRAVSRLIHRG